MTIIKLLSRKVLINFGIKCIADASWSVPAHETMIKKYQDPKEADKLLKLQSELLEVNKIMTKNLDDVTMFPSYEIFRFFKGERNSKI